MSFISFFVNNKDIYILKPLISSGLIKNVKAITKLYYAGTRILPKPDPRHTIPCICTPSLYHN